MSSGKSGPARGRMQSAGVFVVCYGAWFALSGLGLWVALQLLEANPTVTLRLGLSPYAASMWNKTSTVVVLLVWLVGVMALEPYLRIGMERNMLVARIIRVVIIGAVLLGLAEGIQLFG